MEPDETLEVKKQVTAAVKGVTELSEKLEKAVADVAESARRNEGVADEKIAAKAAEIEKSYRAAIEEVKGLVTEGSSKVAQELADSLKRIEELELASQRPANGGTPGADRKSMGQLFAERTILDPEFKSLEARFKEGVIEAKSLPRVGFKTADWLAQKALSLGDTFPPAQRSPRVTDMVAPPQLLMRNLIDTLPADGGVIEYLRYQGASGGSPKSVSSITRSETVATVTVPAHGYRKWDRVLIAGAAQTEYNGYRHILSIVDANSFTVRVVGTPASGSGTMTVVRVNQSGAPEVVAEGSTKPLSAMRWTKETASLVLLAHAIEVTRQTLWHVPGIQAKIDNELMVGLDRVINYQSLWAAGGSGALQGLMTLPATDTQTYAWSEGRNGDTKVDAIRRARTRLEVLDRFPTGVILGPEDWEDIELAKGNDLHYIMMPVPGLPGQPQLLWRMPVLVTSAMDTGSFLEADFQAAATYYLGQDAKMYMTDSDGDNFRKNIITILAEIELQLVVENPSCIVAGTFDSEPA